MSKVCSCVIILCILINLGCTDTKYKNETNNINRMVGQIGKSSTNLQNVRHLVIIPLTGCSPCIQQGILHARLLKEDSSFLFIFSAESFKKINIEFTQSELKNPNYLIDGQSISKQHGLVFDSPVIYTMNNSKVADFKVLNFQNIDMEFMRIVNPEGFE